MRGMGGGMGVVGKGAALWVLSEHPSPGEGGSRCPSRAGAPKQKQPTSQAGLCQKSKQRRYWRETAPGEGCLAPGTEAEPLFPSLFPFSSSGISCTMSSSALLPPTAPWGIGGRTRALALLGGGGGGERRLADLGDEDTRATQEEIQPSLRTGDL